MGKILALLFTAILLQGCSSQLTVLGTVAGSDGTVPQYCMLMLKTDDRLLETTHFVPPNFRRTFAISPFRPADRLMFDCAGYAQREILFSSSPDGKLGKVVLVPSDGT